MSTSFLNNDDEDLAVSRVGPWKNKDEFVQVYNWIFGPKANDETKQKACDQMTVWKLRRQMLTPASVLSTLAILEVQLKDDLKQNDKVILNELRQIYSSSFTRFLNYMSSIMQNKNLKTMYMTAKELGIESFLVDLRHLCAHGQVMPSLDIFRRTATYCLKWLKDFYWHREVKSMKDAVIQDVRLKTSLEFEENIQRLFFVYDAVTEALHKKCKYLVDVDEVLNENYATALKEYAEPTRITKLSHIVGHVVNALTDAATKDSKVRGNAQVYCDTLFACRYFVETASKFYRNNSDEEQDSKSNKSQFIGLHQNLFRSIAISNFIQTCFNTLIDICENEHEQFKRRQGASFWASEIATGFVVFKEFKNVFKTKKEKNSKFTLDFAPINTDIMTKDIRKIYKDLGVNCNGVLIFGDTVRRPWTLTFDKDYIQSRIINVNEFTKDIIQKCIQLCEQPLTANQLDYLTNLINLYVGTNEESNCEDTTLNTSVLPEDDIIPLEENFLKSQQTINDTLNEEGNKRYGVWSEVDDRYNWQCVPLGKLPWE